MPGLLASKPYKDKAVAVALLTQYEGARASRVKDILWDALKLIDEVEATAAECAVVNLTNHTGAPE
jgi:hypothetical protein